jgi:hypothetical protein
LCSSQLSYCSLGNRHVRHGLLHLAAIASEADIEMAIQLQIERLRSGTFVTAR